MNYIERSSESNIKQIDCDFLQGSYILRFNQILELVENNEKYKSQELLFQVLPTIEEIENLGFNLSENQIQFLIKNQYQNQIIDNEVLISLDELKQIKLNEFSFILNDFTILILRAKLLSGESQELQTVIDLIKSVKDNTIFLINNYVDVIDLMKFTFKESDINYCKNLLNPFLF